MRQHLRDAHHGWEGFTNEDIREVINKEIMVTYEEIERICGELEESASPAHPPFHSIVESDRRTHPIRRKTTEDPRMLSPHRSRRTDDLFRYRLCLDEAMCPCCSIV